jgi:hypothetical protein
VGDSGATHLQCDDAAELCHGLDLCEEALYGQPFVEYCGGSAMVVTGRWCSCFHLKDPWHDGPIGKVASKLRLVGSDALNTDSAFSGDILQDLVDEKEWVTVGKNFPNVCIDQHLSARKPAI